MSSNFDTIVSLLLLLGSVGNEAQVLLIATRFWLASDVQIQHGIPLDVCSVRSLCCYVTCAKFHIKKASFIMEP